jgi:hypothetical protein
MAKTWGDIQAEALQLMFSYTINGKSIALSDETADYRAAFANAANYALRDLARVSTPIVRVLSLALAPVPNLLDERTAFNVTSSAGEDIAFRAQDPKSCYFEVDGICTVYLEQVMDDGTLIREAVFNKITRVGFTVFSSLIKKTGLYQLRFEGKTAYNIRNVAFYAVSFPEEAVVDSAGNTTYLPAVIPPFTRFDRYDLVKLTTGQAGYEFMQFAMNPVKKVFPVSRSRADDFKIEQPATLVFDHYTVGQYDIYYHAYPSAIIAPNEDQDIAGTDDSWVPELPDKALDLVALCMAARLFADENGPIASQYLNQYSVARAELSNEPAVSESQDFESERGWY